jgi:NADH-quinone oxidoreductase subunit E
VGRHVVLLCDSVSCWIMGYDRLREHLCSNLGVRLGETTSDGRFTVLPIVCLGTCDHAPAMMVDEDLHRDLDPNKAEHALENYK